MNKDIILEAEFFLSSFFWGIILLFLYDCIRIFRGMKHHTWFAIAAEDCLFWGIAGIFVFHMVYEKNDGIIRAFAAGGMMLGMWLYYILISKWFVVSVIRLLNQAGNLLAKAIYHLMTPFRLIFGKIDKQTGRLSTYLQKIIGKFTGRIKNRLKNRLDKYKMKRREIRKTKQEEKRIKEEIRKAQKRKRKPEKSKEDDNVSQKEKGTLERIEI